MALMKKFIKGIKVISHHLLELIYPPFCVLCDVALEHGTEEVLCDGCREKYPVLSEELCVICGKPLQDKKKERCLDCRKRVHFYEEGKALWVYDEAVKDAIKAYKYRNRREIGVLFGKELARVYNESVDWPIDLVIPVPLYPKKERLRGFNQTRLMAKYFAKRTSLNLAAEGALLRTEATAPQEGLSDKDRMANVLFAFKAEPKNVKDQCILLIDDVYTTGATIDGCAKALVDAGAKDIFYMTIAIGRGY